jgi:hypothetical protein
VLDSPAREFRHRLMDYDFWQTKAAEFCGFLGSRVFCMGPFQRSKPLKVPALISVSLAHVLTVPGKRGAIHANLLPGPVLKKHNPAVPLVALMRQTMDFTLTPAGNCDVTRQRPTTPTRQYLPRTQRPR